MEWSSHHSRSKISSFFLFPVRISFFLPITSAATTSRAREPTIALHPQQSPPPPPPPRSTAADDGILILVCLHGYVSLLPLRPSRPYQKPHLPHRTPPPSPPPLPPPPASFSLTPLLPHSTRRPCSSARYLTDWWWSS